MYAREYRRKPFISAAREMKETVRRQIAWSIGAERFRERDPVSFVTESFQTLFDRVGQEHARALAELDDGEAETEHPSEAVLRQPRELQSGRENEVRTPAGGESPRRDASFGSSLRRFSEMAFQRGGLSASVLAGTGKLMLVSCLKQTLGQSTPQHLQERTIFGIGSQVCGVPFHDPDQMVFNRGFSRTAVGLVVDSLRDARRTVESMTDVALGRGNVGETEGEALRRMYPFLDDSGEKQLRKEYLTKLESVKTPEERAVLQNALVHIGALLGKKAQMKNEFINKLRQISDRATEALAELETPGALEEILNSVTAEASVSSPPPPETGRDGLSLFQNESEAAGRQEALNAPDETDGADPRQEDGP